MAKEATLAVAGALWAAFGGLICHFRCNMTLTTYGQQNDSADMIPAQLSLTLGVSVKIVNMSHCTAKILLKDFFCLDYRMF